MISYRREIFDDPPRQSCVTTLIERNAHINNLDDSFHPYRNFFKDMSELDLFTPLVSINFPTFRDTILLLALRGFLNLLNKPNVNRRGPRRK